MEKLHIPLSDIKEMPYFEYEKRIDILIETMEERNKEYEKSNSEMEDKYSKNSRDFKAPKMPQTPKMPKMPKIPTNYKL